MIETGIASRYDLNVWDNVRGGYTDVSQFTEALSYSREVVYIYICTIF